MIFSAKKFKAPAVVWSLLCLWMLVFSSNAHAAIVGIGVTAKGGTTGIGADVTVPIVSNWINLRLGYNWLEFRPSIDEAGSSTKPTWILKPSLYWWICILCTEISESPPVCFITTAK